MTASLLHRAAAFIWAEADMLDHDDYTAWLDLWTPDGLYIVPIDPRETDYANSLNYAHDDAEMRRMRVERLTGGESISTSPTPRTIRQVSRLRLVEGPADTDGAIKVRAAQFLTSFRKERLHHFAAELEFILVPDSESFRIRRKLVSMINSDDALITVGYIF